MGVAQASSRDVLYNCDECAERTGDLYCTCAWLLTERWGPVTDDSELEGWEHTEDGRDTCPECLARAQYERGEGSTRLPRVAWSEETARRWHEECVRTRALFEEAVRDGWGTAPIEEDAAFAEMESNYWNHHVPAGITAEQCSELLRLAIRRGFHRGYIASLDFESFWALVGPGESIDNERKWR